jgi:hypothetical protein
VKDYYPFALEDGGRLAPKMVDRVDRLAIMVAVRRFPSIDEADSRSLRYGSYARMKEFVRRSTYIPFRRFLGDVSRESMRRLSVVLHGTLGSYLHDALREGIVAYIACLPAPRAEGGFPYFLCNKEI